MPVILAILILIDASGLAYTAIEGLLLEDIDSVRRHILSGVLTTIAVVFTHSLVLFYLIGTGIDIREAAEASPELERYFVPLTRDLKRRVFPAGCFAAFFTIVAAMMGAEVHSRLISASGAVDAPLPIRGVSVWWLHLVVVSLALVGNIWAFIAEFRAAKANRAAIQELNRLLTAAPQAPSESASTDS